LSYTITIPMGQNVTREIVSCIKKELNQVTN
jgi:hypothetical protein